MRLFIVGIALGAILAGGAVAAAQDTGTKGKMFSGIKLADMQARTPEQTVNVALEKDMLRIIDPAAKKDVKTFPYSGLKVSHKLSNMPPEAAGSPESAQTQRGQMPTYMGKGERNWLTLKSGSDEATLRVSSKVYDELKMSLQEHGVTIEEATK
jgi:hypothetical protein